MLAEDVNIKYFGFEPTQDMRSMIDIWLTEVYIRSPSQSFLSATFTLTNGIFEGVVKITSTAENFVAKATDVHISDMGAKLLEKMTSQLDKWKSLRFD